MDRSSIRRLLQRSAAIFVAAAAAAAPLAVTAADYTLAAPAPSAVTVGTTGMITIHVQMTPPNNAAGTKAAPTGLMTVVRQGDTDPIWCYPNTGTLCYTGSLVKGGVDVHVNVSTLAASAGTILFQLRDPSTKAPYSNALAVQVHASVGSASGSHVTTHPVSVKPLDSFSPAPGVPLALHALTPAERDILPDSTKFAVRGHIVLLGQLRAAHKFRMEHGAADRGRALRLALKSKLVMRAGPLPPSKGGDTKAHAIVLATATPFPTNLLVGALTMSPVPQKAADLANMPRDMREFCTAAVATACLYIPTGVYFHNDDATMWTFDPLIDQPTCGADGGVWGPSMLAAFGTPPVCHFTYPTSDVNSFVPGSTPTFKYAFSDSCKPKFTTVADQKGALAINFSADPQTVVSVDTPQSCVGYAYLN